jgi:hypothetical protein
MAKMAKMAKTVRTVRTVIRENVVRQDRRARLALLVLPADRSKMLS